MDAARDAFYHIYDNDEPSNRVDDILEQLYLHPLSITLLATVAQNNQWDTERLTREWKKQRSVMPTLDTKHDKSLAATIELSLTCSIFQDLGPDARELLGVVAFFPQGVDEGNLDWLFPTVSDRSVIFDSFCTLSLAYRSDGFITMLAPVRDYLSPENPKSSPLLCAIKDRYFTRLTMETDPNTPELGEAQWIRSEDVNIEHLLDVFTSTDETFDEAWDACGNFMRHLFLYKPRLVVLGPKCEALPDDHRSKPECLLCLSQLFGAVGNHLERKRLLGHVLGLCEELEDDSKVARTLLSLCETNELLGFYDEGMEQAVKAMDIYERLGNPAMMGFSMGLLALVLRSEDQSAAAEQAASGALEILRESGDKWELCGCHRAVGKMYHFRGEDEKARENFEAALGIASSLNMPDQLFSAHYYLALLSFDEGRLDDADHHVKQAQLSAVHNEYGLGRTMEVQATVWYKQGRLEEAGSEASRAVDVYEKFGATQDAEGCRQLLEMIKAEMEGSDDGARVLVSSWKQSTCRVR